MYGVIAGYNKQHGRAGAGQGRRHAPPWPLSNLPGLPCTDGCQPRLHMQIPQAPFEKIPGDIWTPLVIAAA